MLKIAVCSAREGYAEKLFNTAREIISKSKLKCELSYHVNTDKIISNLKEDIRTYDALFLDMKDTDCLRVSGGLRKRNYKASVIFINDNADGIDKVLKYRPSALITDCGDKEQVLEALKRIYNEQAAVKPYFTVKNREDVWNISFDDILYFESNQRIITIHTKRQVIKFYAKLSDVLSGLPQDQFIRCHQSFVVNMSEVKGINKIEHLLKLSNGEIIEISKSLYSKFIAQIEKNM